MIISAGFSAHGTAQNRTQLVPDVGLELSKRLPKMLSCIWIGLQAW